MNRCSPQSSRLMPVGYGQPRILCAGPCKDKCKVSLQNYNEPTRQDNCCDYLRSPMPSYEQAKQNISCVTQPSKICPSNLQPINVNLKMCQSYPTKEQPNCQPQMNVQYKNHDDCFADCVIPSRPPRCPDGNYAERRDSMRPNMDYVPLPYVFDDRTTYKTFYHPKPAEPRTKMYKPIYAIKTNPAKLEHESTYKKEYIPFPIIPYSKPIWAKIEEFVPNEGIVSGVTSYRSAYQGGNGEPAKSMKPFQLMDPNRDQLDTMTTYKTDYNPYCLESYGKKIVKDNQVPIHCVPFRGETTYRKDYIPVSSAPRKSMKRETLAFRNNISKTGNTTYKTEFVPFHFNKECKDNMPTKEYDQLYPRNTCCDVDCHCAIEQPKEPLRRPSPPCPSTDCRSDPCINENYKVKVTNENNEFEPTQINVTTSPACYSYCG